MKMTKSRNYGLDVVKMLLTICVFFVHTIDFDSDIVNRSAIIRMENLGWYPVHFFFVISGFLMMNSFFRCNREYTPQECGKAAGKFVFGRFKGIAPMYYTAFFMSLVFYLLSDSNRLLPDNIINTIYRIVPEALMINMAGFKDALYLNLPTWYIQAMLICMLPLYYLLCRNKNLFCYIIVPLGFLASVTFLYNNEKTADSAILPSEIIRGFAGLLSGCGGYILYRKIGEMNFTKAKTPILTALEIMIYAYSFAGCFFVPVDTKYNLLGTFVFPAAVALTFSGKTFTAKLFSSPKLKVIGTVSTFVYFNHWLARRIVLTYFPGKSWGESTLYMAAITVLTCIICAVLRKLFSLGARKIKE